MHKSFQAAPHLNQATKFELTKFKLHIQKMQALRFQHQFQWFPLQNLVLTKFVLLSILLRFGLPVFSVAIVFPMLFFHFFTARHC